MGVFTVECVEKIRDKNGKITNYILQDAHFNRYNKTPEKLKELIFDGHLKVSNLKLTRDGRLIDDKSSDTDIMVKESKEGAEKFIVNLAEGLDELGLKVQYQTRCFDNGKTLPCAILYITNNGDIKAKTSLLDSYALPNKPAKVETVKSGLASKLAPITDNGAAGWSLVVGAELNLMRSAEDGTNVMHSFTLYVGKGNIDSAITNIPLLKDLELYLNSKLDQVEASLYAMRYNKNNRATREVTGMQLVSDEIVKAAATSTASFIFEALRVETQVTAMQRELGEAITRIAGNMISNQAQKAMEASGYNKDIVNMYKDKAEQNLEQVNKASERLGVTSSITKSLETKDKKAGLFGIFKR